MIHNTYIIYVDIQSKNTKCHYFNNNSEMFSTFQQLHTFQNILIQRQIFLFSVFLITYYINEKSSPGYQPFYNFPDKLRKSLRN